MPIQSIEPQRLYRQIADQLRQLIRAGEFAPTTRLPSERELALQLSVSRPSVREALIALEAEGWVEVRVGSGVYVQQQPGATPPKAVLASEWGPLELIRARRVLEGEIAALAAQSAKRRDIVQLQNHLQAMQDQVALGHAPLAPDAAFHTALASCCGNAVLSETVQGFLAARHGKLFTRLGGYFETPASWRAALSEHHAVLEAVQQHDPHAARLAMQHHMDRAHARFSASWRRAQDHT